MDLYAELVGIFQDEAAACCAELNRLTSAGDGPAVAALAHKIKGSLAALGARCVGAAETLEKTAKMGSLDERCKAVNVLESELKKLWPVLNTLIGKELV